MNPMRTCYVRHPTSPIQDGEGTDNLESQEARKQAVNKQLLQLGVSPQDIAVKKGEIFSRLLQEAKNNGIYKGPEENTTIYEEIEEEVEDGSAPEYDSDATTNDENEQDSNAILFTEVPIGKNGKRVRGPTALKRFWKEYDMKNKINVQFNSDGQPCGVNSCRLTNFIGSLVKGKDISCAASNWSKVPNHEKEKLWKTVKFFFNIPDCYKSWVLRTASRKWKNFKCYLKAKYFKDELSLRMNISNGCKGRIPAPQWAWLCKYNKTAKAKALCEQNSKTRNAQANAVHAAGTRSFAVVAEQEELINGRKPSRAELYRVTHTNNKGNAVDDFSRIKIADIVEKFTNHPELIGEEPHVGDYYSTLFPKGQNSVRHGTGLVVGGNTTEKLARVVSALNATKAENRELRVVVDSLVQSQTSLIARSEKLEKQYSKMMKMLKLGEESADEFDQTSDEDEDNQVPELNLQKNTMEVQQADQLEKGKSAMVIDEVEEQKSNQHDRNKRASVSYQVEEELIPATKKKKLTLEEQKIPAPLEKAEASTSKTVKIEKLRKVKLEKVEEMKRSGGGNQHILNMNCNCDPCIRKKIKKGMEVGLTSPNSLQLVALGTIQNSDAASVGLDGNVLSDCVEVMVNIVYKSATKLPRPLGRLTKMGNAQAKCIPWPRNNVTSRDCVNDPQPLLPARTKDKKQPQDTYSQPPEMNDPQPLLPARTKDKKQPKDTYSQPPEMNDPQPLLPARINNKKQPKDTYSQPPEMNDPQSGNGDTESQEANRKLKSLDMVNESIASQPKRRSRSKKLSVPVDGES